MLTSLRSRLVLSYVLVVILTLCIAGAGLLLLLQDFERGLLSQRLVAALGPAALQARTALAENRTPSELATEIHDQVDASWRVMLVGSDRTILADSRGELVGAKLPANLNPVVTVAPRRFVTGQVNLGGRALSYAAANLNRPNGSTVALVIAAIPRPFLSAVEDLAGPLLAAAAIALAVAIVIGLLLAASIADPLARLTRATEEIARGNYSELASVEGEGEVGRLSASFNAMVLAVRRSQQIQKDFVANVSHELKTPLTSIQGFAQAIAEGALRDTEGIRHAGSLIYDESQRMARLVGDLLTLARLDAGEAGIEHKAVDLRAVLPVWVERFQKRAGEAGVTLQLAVDSPPLIEGDADRLEQVVSNLLDNAIKYNRLGGRVDVSAGRDTTQVPDRRGGGRRPAESAQEWAVISISDTGVGIPAAGQSRLFERFYRADKSRAAGGSGLGLAIVREIVNAHRGRIQFRSEEGKGTTFQVWFPGRS